MFTKVVKILVLSANKLFSKQISRMAPLARVNGLLLAKSTSLFSVKKVLEIKAILDV